MHRACVALFYMYIGYLAVKFAGMLIGSDPIGYLPSSLRKITQ